jgi:hypothetical protein
MHINSLPTLFIPRMWLNGRGWYGSRRLAEHGCTPHEIMSITGHRTFKEVTRYTDATDRKHLAEIAMQKTTTGTLSGKP